MLKVVHDESDPNATSGSASCSLLDEIPSALPRRGTGLDKGVLVERPDDHESRCDRQVA